MRTSPTQGSSHTFLQFMLLLNYRQRTPANCFCLACCHQTCASQCKPACFSSSWLLNWHTTQHAGGCNHDLPASDCSTLFCLFSDSKATMLCCAVCFPLHPAGIFTFASLEFVSTGLFITTRKRALEQRFDCSCCWSHVRFVCHIMGQQ